MENTLIKHIQFKMTTEESLDSGRGGGAYWGANNELRNYSGIIRRRTPSDCISTAHNDSLIHFSEIKRDEEHGLGEGFSHCASQMLPEATASV